ncbi:MAG: sodium:calcium antiporter [Actinomycetota bacterium]|nr:sodium:calcium antiporter [Actinomycetota bacterium]
MLVAGAELFAENAVGTARRLRVSVLAVGLLLAGAEPEELVTGILASAQHRPELAAGDAIGANVTLLTLALGLAALGRPLPVSRRVRSYAVLSSVAGVLAVLTLLDGRVSRVEGGLLMGAYLALVGLVWWREKQPPALGELAEVAEAGRVAKGSSTRALLLLLAGVGLMVGGGDLAVAGAVRVAAAFGQSDSAVGLSVLALATTAELLALFWSSARRGLGEIAVAGLIGSAACNATASLAAAALTRPLVVTGIKSAAILAAALPLVAIVLAGRGRLGRVAGIALVAAYGGYLVAVLK